MLLLITLTGPVVVAPPIEFSSDSRLELHRYENLPIFR